MSSYSPETVIASHPRLPYRNVCRVSAGSFFRVSGQVKSTADRFEINLECGNGDCALHINPRFGYEDAEVVLNSKSNGNWGNEERCRNPFRRDEHFELQLFVEGAFFRLLVNGSHLHTYRHRVPLARISKLTIEDDCVIENLSISGVTTAESFDSGFGCPPPPGSGCPPPPGSGCYPPAPGIQNPDFATCPPGPGMGYGFEPVLTPQLPFSYDVPEMQVGRVIHISGRPTQYPDKFSINLQTNRQPNVQIGLHLSVRFHPENCVVRNSTDFVGNWMNEERHQAHFPFMAGAHFDAVIKIGYNSYEVIVNGRRYCEFRCRSGPVSKYENLMIDGDVLISCIRFE